MDEPPKYAPLSREVVVPNREGLHFRPIMQFVDKAIQYSCSIKVRHKDREADGRSPMELLMLVAPYGSQLVIVAQGADAAPALDALTKLVESGFGES